MISFRIPTKPVPKARPRFAKTKRGTIIYTPKATTEYENTIAQYALEARTKAGIPLITDPVELSITISPQETYISIKKIDNHKFKIRGDLDNVLKAILDALQGVIYKNDKQVKSINIKLIGEAK